jgi:hypothetical protein
MRDTRRGWRIAVVVGAVAVFAVAAVPFATGQAEQGPSPTPQGCQLQSPQPEAPLKLNLIAVRGLAKTIVMEKEVFECFNAQGTLSQVRDVETFIEVVDRAGKGKEDDHKSKPSKKFDEHSKPVVKTVAKSASVATCIKDLTSGRVSCRFDRLQLGTTNTPLAGCSTKSGTYPFPPVTVSLGNGLVKTVKVEKEVLDCAGAIGDVYLFTNMLERTDGKSFAPTTSFNGVICLKNASTAHVTSCRTFTPGKAS